MGVELSPNSEEQRAPQRGVWEIFEQRPWMRVSSWVGKQQQNEGSSLRHTLGLQDIQCRKTLRVQGRRGLEEQMHYDCWNPSQWKK